MANIEDKLLDGPNVGYCSSSEDEEPASGFVKADDDRIPATRPGTGSQTGPKGVLTDYKLHQAGKYKEMRENAEHIKELRLKMAVAPSKPEEDEDEDELAKIRNRRLQTLKSSTQGRIHEIQDKDQFLQILDESSSNTLIIIHIYRDGSEACGNFNEVLTATSVRCTGNVQFYKVQASVLDTTRKFAENALPTCQVYIRGELAGNFIRIHEEFGGEYDADEFCQFLRRWPMALLDTGRSPELPLGVVLSIKDETSERVLFVYPTRKQKLEKLIEDSNEQLVGFRKPVPLKSWKEDVRFGISLNVFGSVLAPRDTTEKNIINKVNSLRVIGQWFPLRDNQKETVSIVFVLAGHCSMDAVTAHLSLAKQVCGAVQALETTSAYVKEQITIVQKIQDEIEQNESEEFTSPFEKSLHECTLLQSMQRIYEDIVQYGNNVLYLDRHIQLTLCLQSKSFIYCTLLPRTISALHEMLKNIEPFHTLLFVEEMKVSAEQNPLLASFVEHCTPDKSFEEVRLKMRCTMVQVIRLARNVVQWGRGVIIFPTCLQNSYTVGPPGPTNFTELAKLYDELYPSAPRTSMNKPPLLTSPPVTSFLAEVLEFFSPAITLEEYYVNTARFLPRAANTETFVFLLKTGLVMQLHIHIELIEPTQIWLQGKSISKDITPRIKTLVGSCQLLKEEFEGFKEYVLLVCSNLLTIGVTENEVFKILGYFVCLIPHFLACDYMEKIIYRTGLTRSNINRVIELFGPILLVFEVPAKLRPSK
ncbi:hypothetical protein FO519_007844 [Halicephalobus sp. NKZ332]|nr:hypothetical protein FO519_007844 [Halicephalobus sp. NKZ332]